MLGVRLSISNQIKSSGVLGDFDPSKDAVPLSQLPPSDRYVLTAASTLLREADAGYRSYRLRPVLTVRPAQVNQSRRGVCMGRLETLLESFEDFSCAHMRPTALPLEAECPRRGLRWSEVREGLGLRLGLGSGPRLGLG